MKPARISLGEMPGAKVELGWPGQSAEARQSCGERRREGRREGRRPRWEQPKRAWARPSGSFKPAGCQGLSSQIRPAESGRPPHHHHCAGFQSPKRGAALGQLRSPFSALHAECASALTRALDSPQFRAMKAQVTCTQS